MYCVSLVMQPAMLMDCILKLRYTRGENLRSLDYAVQLKSSRISFSRWPCCPILTFSKFQKENLCMLNCVYQLCNHMRIDWVTGKNSWVNYMCVVTKSFFGCWAFKNFLLKCVPTFILRKYAVMCFFLLLVYSYSE